MTTAPPHVCEPDMNPRHQNSCKMCGRLIPDPPARDRDRECEITREVASALGVDIEALNAMATQRADRGQLDYGYDFPSLQRSMEREALEELADARNYLVWRLDAIHRGLDDDDWRVEHLQPALKCVAQAFEHVRRAL